jgi:hypothetical protein
MSDGSATAMEHEHPCAEGHADAPPLASKTGRSQRVRDPVCVCGMENLRWLLPGAAGINALVGRQRHTARRNGCSTITVRQN